MGILNDDLISRIDDAIPVQFNIYNLPNDRPYLLNGFLKRVDKLKQHYNAGNWCLQTLKELLERALFEVYMENHIHITGYPHVSMHIRHDSFNIHDDRFRCQRQSELEIEIDSPLSITFCISPIPPYKKSPDTSLDSYGYY